MNRLLEKERLDQCWVWGSKTTGCVQSEISGLKDVLNAPCGLSELGTVFLDAEPKRKGVIQGDIRKLPFPDESFDAVIQDPPWKIGYYQRMKPFFEAVRVTRPGGVIIYNATWIPNSRQVKLEKLLARRDDPWANASFLSIFRKRQNGGKQVKL